MSNVITWRRDLHQIPELGLKEYKTTDYLISALEKMGYQPQRLLETGCYVFIDKGATSTIAFRSDIDGLSVNEDTNLPYASTHEGRMHACGHDGHMAMLLGLAEAIKDEALNYNVLLVFQPAEEEPGGAKPLIEQGLFKKYPCIAIFGFHLMPYLPKGQIGLKAGPLMAECGELDVTITGLSSHAGMPHIGVDTIVIAATLISQFQSIVTRSISPLESAVLHIGEIHGGTARNSLAETTHFHGTIRAYSEVVFDTMVTRMKQLAKSVEVGYGCQVEVKCEPMYPPVINDDRLVQKLSTFLDAMHLKEPLMLAEDFSFYQKQMPGVFLFLGVGDAKHQASLHAPQFDFDESVLETGVQTYLQILKNLKD